MIKEDLVIQALKEMPAILNVIDTHYNIHLVGGPIARKFENLEQAIGQKCYKLFQNQDRPCPWCKADRAIKTGETITEATAPEDPREKLAGRPLSICVRPLKNKNGDVVGVLELATDISELKGVDAVLKRAYDELQTQVHERTADLLKVNDELKCEIRERMRAEQAVNRRNEEFRLVAENVPGLLSYVGADGRYRFVNKHYEAWFSLPAEKIVGKHCREILGEETYERIRHHVETALSGHRVRYEEALPYKHGGARWVMVDYVPNTDDTGRPEGFFALVSDVTDRKQAEKLLQSQLGLEQVVASVSRRFVNLASHEIDDGITHALETIGVFSGVDRSYVFLFRDNGTRMDNTHEWCADGIEPQIKKLQGLSADAAPWWMDKLNRSENIHIPRVADLSPEASAEREILQSQGIQSLIVVPIVHGGGLVGFIGFDSVREEKTWPQDSITLLQLVAEIFANALERKKAEETLRKTNEELQDKTHSLEQVNAALSVLLERRDRDKAELEEKVTSNVKELILPYIERIKKTPLHSKQRTCVDIVESNLREIVSPFLRELTSKYFGLTPKEIRIAGLIKRGMTTKEISEILGVSARVVQFHRNNIRAKLGLKNQRVNLGAYLLSF